MHARLTQTPSPWSRCRQWTAGKHGLRAVAVSGDGTRIAVASTSISLYDLSSKQMLVRWTGHARAVTALSFTPDSAWLVSAAAEDRFVNVWDVNTGAVGKKHKGAPAVSVLTAKNVPLQVSVAAGSAAGAFNVAAASVAGKISVWADLVFTTGGDGGQGAATIPPSAHLNALKGTNVDVDARLCRLVWDPSAVGKLHVARGSFALPSFAALSIYEADDGEDGGDEGRAVQSVLQLPNLEAQRLLTNSSGAEAAASVAREVRRERFFFM